MFKQFLIVLVVIFFSISIVRATHAAENPKLYLKDNVLVAGIYNNSNSSSDLSLIIRVDVKDETIIDEGSEMGYIVPQKDIKGWTAVDFDASSWQIGVSGIGYSDNDDNTQVRGIPASVYTRYYFDVPSAKDAREITFYVDYDDAYIFWLNGVEIARSQNIQNVAPNEEPGWNEPIGRITDHESSDQPAGKPNPNRWDNARIEKIVVEYDFGGDVQKGVGAKPTGEASESQAPLYTKGNVLAAANFNDGPGSSDMTLVLRLSGDGEIYVDEGSPVKHIHDPDNSGIPDEWIQTKYNDEKWNDGFSSVGFSDNDDNTVTPAGLISVWTRYRFDAPNASKIKELVLLADYDDSYIVWLNGVMIAFGGSPPLGDPPAWNATQGGNGSNHESSDQVAGKPNKIRWDRPEIQKTIASFRFAGSSAVSVDSAGKLTTTWGNLKKN